MKLRIQELRDEIIPAAQELLRMCEDSFTCRRKAFVSHFGYSYEKENCGACDVCYSKLIGIKRKATESAKILLNIITTRVDRNEKVAFSALIQDALREENSDWDQLRDTGTGTLEEWKKEALMRKTLIQLLLSDAVEERYIPDSRHIYLYVSTAAIWVYSKLTVILSLVAWWCEAEGDTKRDTRGVHCDGRLLTV